jgi:hypothetical protein
MRFHQDDVPGLVAAHALGFAFFDLRHLPLQQVFSVRRKFLHAPGHIDDVKIVLASSGDRARLVQLPHPGAARADDFDAAEKFAFDGRAFAIIHGAPRPKQAANAQSNAARGKIFAGFAPASIRPTPPPAAAASNGSNARTSSNRQSALTCELWP